MGKLSRFYDSVPLPFRKAEVKESNSNNNTPLLKAVRPPHVDVIQTCLGNVGRWQIEVFILMFILTTPCNWVELGIELFGNETDFWCKLPDSNITSNNVTESPINSDEICEIQRESNGTQNPCPYGYEYDLSPVGTTIISEWDLVCDQQYLVSLAQVIIMLGNLLGAIIFGIAADKFGRRLILILSCVLRFIFGLLSGCAPDVTTFIILRFLLALFDGGVPGIALMMCLEVLGGKPRLILAVLYQTAFNVGFPVMALVTYWLKNWRYSQIILYTLSLVTILCSWIMPESPRWLLAVGKKVEAVSILEKASMKNKRDASIVIDLVKNYDDEDKNATENTCFCLYLFITPKLRKRTILVCVNGMILFTNVYGMYQLFGEFGTYPILNLSIQGITAISGSIISALIVNSWNRRRTLAGTTFIMGLCSLIVLAAPTTTLMQNIVSSIIFCCIGVMMSIIEPIVGELFPTVLRNSGFGVFSIFVGIGSMIAPVIISLEAVHARLPLGIFALLSLLEIIFVLLLPETKDQELSETVEDVDN